jgi:hypothetical protein
VAELRPRKLDQFMLEESELVVEEVGLPPK